MIKISTALAAIAILFFLSGCSHTNELAKYDIRGKGMQFNEFVESGARRITITKQENNPNQKEDNSILSTIASIGSDIVSEDAKARIINSVSTHGLVTYISNGLEDALVKYLDIVPVEENPEFIAETILEVCDLVVGDNGISLRVQAKARIIERATGNVVWDNWESQTIPIKSGAASKDDSKTLKKVFSAIQLSSLNEDEINTLLGDAADDVGYMMGETLREDVVKAKKK
jgi:hypothetical protein